MGHTKKFIGSLSLQQISLMPSTVLPFIWYDIVVHSKECIFSLPCFWHRAPKTLGISEIKVIKGSFARSWLKDRETWHAAVRGVTKSRT